MNLEPPPTFSTPRLTVCHRHPLEPPLTSFCASCLRERLSGLDSSSSTSTSNSLHKSSTTTSALKSIFRTSNSSAVTDNNNNNLNKDPSASASSSSFFPELRRSKSFSGRKAEGLSGGFEPQRKSCDVRGRNNNNTLWCLFNKDEDKKVEICGEVEVDSRNLGFLGVGDPVIENKEEEEEEIRVPVSNASNVVEVIEEEEEEEEEEGEEKELKMKDHIDQETQHKRPAGGRDLKESLWFAASVFSKKLQKWRRKQKMKKSETSTSGGGLSTAMRVDKPLSEMADYGYGRRSCDIDPRFSLDIGRMSFDDPRYSLDEPRASWDGYLIGRTFPRLAPMVSVVEDVPIPVKRVDNQIPVEEPLSSVSGDNTTPGGTAQTREYYSDSSQRRRKSFDRSSSKSFDRSSSMRKKAAAVGAEMDDSKSGSNSKVSPTSVDLFHGAKLIGTDRDARDSKSNSLRDDRSESFESASRELGSVSCSIDQKGLKKSSRWSKAWNIWGLINKKSGSNKDEEEERGYNRGNVVERSFSESWQDTRKDANGESKGGLNRILRSNSSVSSRNPINTGGAFGGMKNVADINGFGKKKREEVVLERTRSARYSSADADNGLLRFYLTPLRNKRSLSGNGRPKNPQSIARRVLRLY